MRWLIALSSILWLSGAMAAQCIITSDTSPPLVASGSTHNFTASAGCGGSLNWTLNVGASGSINASTGVYTAPVNLAVQNVCRGVQCLPVNSVWNTSVAALSVDTDSATWLTRAAQDHPLITAYHHLRFLPQILNAYDNPVDNSTPTQIMVWHLPYGGPATGTQPIPLDRVRLMENGVSLPQGKPNVQDRREIATNHQNSTTYEMYNLYLDVQSLSWTNGNPTSVVIGTHTIWTVPQGYDMYISGGTGAWAAANGHWLLTPTAQVVGTSVTGTFPFDSTTWGAPNAGLTVGSISRQQQFNPYCPSCNSGGGQTFGPGSYSQLSSTTAAGNPIDGPYLKMEEWYAATQAGDTDLGHALSTTVSNCYLSQEQQWPASQYAFSVCGFRNSITSATNANPTVLTLASDESQAVPCANYTYTVGCTFAVRIKGADGNWSGINGDQTCTAIDNYHCSLPINATSFGPLTGIGTYLVPQFFKYGATLRMKSSVSANTVCGSSADLTTQAPYCRVLVNTMKNYGLVITDGTYPADNYDTGVMNSEFHPKVLIDAATQIVTSGSIQPIESYVDVVNRASQYGPDLHSPPNPATDLSLWQEANANETRVTVTGSAGTASIDVLLQGAVIGTDRERINQVASSTYQTNVWITGTGNTGLTYTLGAGITGASVNGSGVLTMPACTTNQTAMLVVTQTSSATAYPLYIEVMCIPVSSDGGYRLALGNYTGNYVDAGGKTWWTKQASQAFNNSYENIAIYSTHNGTWQGNPPCANDTWSGVDTQLNSRSTNQQNDTRVDLVGLTNGTYTVTLLGEPGFGGFGPGNTCGNTAGNNIQDWMVQGTVINSNVDGFVQAGNQPYAGYTLSTVATVSDKVLVSKGNIRVPSVYGMSQSSLMIAPTSGQPLQFVTAPTLPGGTQNVAYSTPVNASGGTPPYTFTLLSGTFPTGVSISSAGLISGTPTVTGTFSPVIQVCDTVSACIHQTFSLTISPPSSNFFILLPATALPNGMLNAPYSTTVVAVNGTNPLSWCVLETNGNCDSGIGGALPAGLTINTVANNGVISGTPNVLGLRVFTLRVTDNTGRMAQLITSINILSSAPPPPQPNSFSMTGNFTGQGNVTLTTH